MLIPSHSRARQSMDRMRCVAQESTTPTQVHFGHDGAIVGA